MAIHNLERLRQTLQELPRRQIALDAFCQTWRQQETLLNQLPPRYRQVMEDLLRRLETGSQFSEESCSYSQHELLDNLAVWLDKAHDAMQGHVG
ncbi:MAG: hypothetical protein JO269_12480 [Burkholderiaceae bacterium]|nr:hypothetical protein [Burkholderiaceae bacterium]